MTPAEEFGLRVLALAKALQALSYCVVLSPVDEAWYVEVSKPGALLNFHILPGATDESITDLAGHIDRRLRQMMERNQI